MAAEAENQITAKERYAQLERDRNVVLDRAQRAAKLTIPSLLPEDGHGETSELPQPYQSMGARGLNNLASKLLTSLVPPNSPFFNMTIDEQTLSELEQQAGQDRNLRGEVMKALSSIEQTVMTVIEQRAIRVSVFEALKQLLVAGNVLLFIPPGLRSRVRVYHLNRFVTKRDPMGNILEIIVKENVSPSALPDRVRELLDESESYQGENGKPVEKTKELYTYIYRYTDGNNKQKFKVYQEIDGKKVPKSEGTYKPENLPWLPLRYTSIDGEDYGRGFIEEYEGDLHSLEELTRAIVEGSAAASKVVFLVSPNGTTRKKDIAEAPNGAVRDGLEEDVSTLQMEKYGDFRTAQETLNDLKERLSFAFLLNTSIQRDAERVTATEVRFMAQELENALGGLYSILSQEFQLPLVKVIISQLNKAGQLPNFPQDKVQPQIVTGLEALGRGNDLQNLDTFIAGLADAFGPEATAQYINVDEYLARRAAALGIDADGLVKSRQQIADESRRSQMRQMIDQMGPNAVDQMGQAMQKQMEQDNGSGQEQSA